jgi:NADPH-dependent 2,4-dienoyl-CoA reductase/sulfur reductase-like enzyme/nitrite reductase/ring-hydroxylating ferredoxin subunit
MAQDVAPADGAMRQVEFEGTQVLLLPDGDAVRAIAATCPHAGAPLAEGVRHGTRIICPWHKAAFCIRTGAVLDPPAVDALERFDARISGGRVLLSRPPKASEPPPQRRDDRVFVIVGGGAAGAVAAQTLREEGFAGRLVLLDRENRVPYDRTMLSKYLLSGEHGAEKSPLQSQSWYATHAIERRTADVTSIDPQARRITCADGSVLPYDAALLATGATPRRPTLPGAERDHVFLLRSRADAEAILAQAERSSRAVVLGASFIGMEVAASLRERGLDVTVVAPDAAPFEKHLGARIGGAFTRLHESRGVQFRLGRQASSIDDDFVHLRDGETLPAELVVIGVGVQPATGFAGELSRQPDHGIQVDAFLRVADGLYAAGDIARFPSRGDGDPIRVEHWRVAQQHGRIAARNMLGQQLRYDAVPVFWTIQYLKRLDYIGHATEWDEVVVHGDPGKPEFLAYYISDGKVAAAVGMDRDRDTAALIELLTLRRDWTADALGESPAAVLEALSRASA